jgi:1-phosphatidylinositol-3-phosphate 5-kinase
VAELVQRYQDSPPDAIHPSSPVPETRQEANVTRIRRTRSKKAGGRQPLLSDFEQSYAANVAPKYLTHVSRRQGSNTPHSSRIPGPIAPVLIESRPQSRQTSPEKRQRNSGIASKTQSSAISDTGGKTTKSKPARLPSRDKSSVRPNASAHGKSTFRRSVSSTGGKVSNIARHFERISKDSERANRRYAVIRGRRARPVASARPKVQVFDNIQDVIGNETESSDSSTDADDEDDDDDELQVPPPDPISRPELAVEPEVRNPDASDSSRPQQPDESVQCPVLVLPSQRPESITQSSGSLGQSPSASVPPSPSLPTLPVNSPALTPPEGRGPTAHERISFMNAISGLWSQQLQPTTISNPYEDALADPVHIHRDSPIALRTDEPTSIIAVALRYGSLFSISCYLTLRLCIVVRTTESGKKQPG